MTGAPRSGTTVTHHILNEHPEVALFPECPFDKLVDSVDRVFDCHRIRRAEVEAIAQGADREIPHAAEGEESVSKRVAAYDSFYEERENSTSRRYSIQAPSAELLEPLLSDVYRRATGKNDLSVLGVHKPNFYDLTKIQYLRSKLGTVKFIVVIRRPMSVVNSSLHLRNKAKTVLDPWSTQTVERAINEYRMSLLGLTFLAMSSPPEDILIVKYDDLQKKFDQFNDKVCRFLDISGRLDGSFFDPLPKEMGYFAMEPWEQEEAQNAVGDIEAIWEDLDLTGLCTADRLHSLCKMAVPFPASGQMELSDGSASQYLLGLWGEVEPWGRWTIGQTAGLLFKISARKALCWLTFNCMVAPGNPKMQLAVHVNGRVAGKWMLVLEVGVVGRQAPDVILLQAPNKNEMTIAFPLDLTEEDEGVCRLELRIDGACSPLTLGTSDDPRELGLGLRRLVISDGES